MNRNDKRAAASAARKEMRQLYEDLMKDLPKVEQGMKEMISKLPLLKRGWIAIRILCKRWR